MYWDKLSHTEIKNNIFSALEDNTNYRTGDVLGVPASYLDSEEFYPQAPFLKDAPYLSAFIANPNHIGCHTLDNSQSEQVFKGTQRIEKELIHLIGEEILGGEENAQDGYVATGGTEGNIEAIWIYRNFFKEEYGAKNEELALVYSEDSHYSMPKASNLLGIDSIVAKVEESNRQIIESGLRKQIEIAYKSGKRYFVFVLNMGTTMFGSVDNLQVILSSIKGMDIIYRIHIDAAFGGFIYPFSNKDSELGFGHPEISSVVLDGHKMLQAPYGTGVFLIRKNYMKYVCSEDAKYVAGHDYTLCGSRSGANAIALWMILKIHGSEGWKAKIQTILDRTSRFCDGLDEQGVEYYRNPYLNIVAIKSGSISDSIAENYHLVPDDHDKPKWWKVVVMPHVKNGMLHSLLDDIEATNKLKA